MSCFVNGSYPYYNTKLYTCSFQCADGYYQSNNKCLNCHYTCLNCKNYSSSSCLSCLNTSDYPYYNSDLGICSDNCSILNYILFNDTCICSEGHNMLNGICQMT